MAMASSIVLNLHSRVEKSCLLLLVVKGRTGYCSWVISFYFNEWVKVGTSRSINWCQDRGIIGAVSGRRFLEVNFLHVPFYKVVSNTRLRFVGVLLGFREEPILFNRDLLASFGYILLNDA